MRASRVSFPIFVIACAALFAAVAVYYLARSNPPALLTTILETDPVLAERAAIFGSAPSFLYTLAIGLLVGAFASSRAGARLHCMGWTGLALGLELTQHPIVADPLATWLFDRSISPAWTIFGFYWSHGVFDTRDLFATILGGLIALFLLARFAHGNESR